MLRNIAVMLFMLLYCGDFVAAQTSGETATLNSDGSISVIMTTSGPMKAIADVNKAFGLTLPLSEWQSILKDADGNSPTDDKHMWGTYFVPADALAGARLSTADNSPTRKATISATRTTKPIAMVSDNKPDHGKRPTSNDNSKKGNAKKEEAVCRTQDGNPIRPEEMGQATYNILCGGAFNTFSTLNAMDEAESQKKARMDNPGTGYDPSKLDRQVRLRHGLILLAIILIPGLIAVSFCLKKALWDYRGVPWLPVKNNEWEYRTPPSRRHSTNNANRQRSVPPPPIAPVVTNPFANPTYIHDSYSGPAPAPTTENGFIPHLFIRDLEEVLRQECGEEFEAAYETNPNGNYIPDIIITVLLEHARKTETAMERWLYRQNFDLALVPCDIWGSGDGTVLKFYRLGNPKTVQAKHIMGRILVPQPAVAEHNTGVISITSVKAVATA